MFYQTPNIKISQRHAVAYSRLWIVLNKLTIDNLNSSIFKRADSLTLTYVVTRFSYLVRPDATLAYGNIL